MVIFYSVWHWGFSGILKINAESGLCYTEYHVLGQCTICTWFGRSVSCVMLSQQPEKNKMPLKCGN